MRSLQDFTEVDNNVTRHVPDELARDDWNAMIMHYLGLDHIGHKTGPQGPNMLAKQREMDGITRQIFEAMQTQKHHANTLLVLAGDHGMNAGGNHGGSGPGETEPALLFASPKFQAATKRNEYPCPTAPKEGTEFHYYSKIEQSDVVPAIAGMMGLPISRNSLGVVTPELAGLWTQSELLRMLYQNSKQVSHIVKAKYGTEFDESAALHADMLTHHGPSGDYPCRLPEDQMSRLAWDWGEVMNFRSSTGQPEGAEEAFYRFLHHAQNEMSDTASLYDIPRMIAGIAIIAAALALAVYSLPWLWPPSSGCLFFTVICLLYGVMMFASSYVEEEQHLWYWLTPAWITVLTTKCVMERFAHRNRRLEVAVAGIMLLAMHRIAIRWNQTGQKHAGEPDIVHTIFPEHHVLMWMLILATYLTNGLYLHNRTFAGIFMPEIAAFGDVFLVVPAVVFKLNFTQADSPELVQGLAIRLREWTEPFSLVLQARFVFAALTLTTVAVIVLSINKARAKANRRAAEEDILLSERLHHLLALFLMTQTRAPNIPLFLVFELLRLSMANLMSTVGFDLQQSSRDTVLSPAQVATGALLLSHVSYFCIGGSNSISSIDLTNAYNGVAGYSIAAVGALLLASNWAGPILWCSAAILLLAARPRRLVPEQRPKKEVDRAWVDVERTKLHDDAIAVARSRNDAPAVTKRSRWEPWLVYISSMTTFTATSLLTVMAACTALRTHLFIWTVFSPKYLYVLAWSVGWHLTVNIILGGLLFGFGTVA